MGILVDSSSSNRSRITHSKFKMKLINASLWALLPRTIVPASIGCNIPGHGNTCTQVWQEKVVNYDMFFQDYTLANSLSGFSSIEEWYNDIGSSINLSNARFARVDDQELGNELFAVPPYISWANEPEWGAHNGINGDRLGGFVPYHTGGTTYLEPVNWFADIENNPSVNFVRIWAPNHANLNIFFNAVRVYIHSAEEMVECFQTEFYTLARTAQLREAGQALILGCPTTIHNAQKVRVDADQLISFNELEVAWGPHTGEEPPATSDTADSAADLLSKILETVGDHNVDNIQADDFLSHGCYCPRLDGTTVFKGPTISKLDKLCQRFSHCGICSGDIECGAGNGYPFTFTYGEEYDGAECDANTNNACQQARCECSMATVKDLIEAVFEQSERVTQTACPSRSGGNQDDAVVVAAPADAAPADAAAADAAPNGTAGASETERRCCGEGSRWMMYSPDKFDCEVADGLPSLVHQTSNVVKNF